jgi:hypothetical protein
MAVLLLLLGSAEAQAPRAPTSKERHAMRWKTSAGWKQYKRYYTQLKQTKTISELEAVSSEIDDWIHALDEAFPGQTALVQALRQLMFLKMSSQRTLLRKPPQGKLPATDFPADLLNTLKVLGVELQVLRGLRALEGTDPWIDKTLLPELHENRASAVDLRQYLEKNLAHDPRTPGLLHQSGELLRNLQELLGDLPQEPRRPHP